jgi:hypothetical protein
MISDRFRLACFLVCATVVLAVGVGETASLHPSKPLLSRPDQNVAWRGDELPNDSIGLIDRERGSYGET